MEELKIVIEKEGLEEQILGINEENNQEQSIKLSPESFTTRNHANLENLDYENSGHTGFQKAGDYALKSDIPNVPTKTSELENDSNFIINSDLPKVKKLDTFLRSYSTSQWATDGYGKIGSIGGWGGINNINDFKIGDIAFLDGKDNTTGYAVKLIGEVTAVVKDENHIKMKALEFITYLDKVDNSYSSSSKNAQSGVAVQQAINNNKTDAYNATSSKSMTGKAVAQALKTLDEKENVKYYKFRDTTVNFELKKGHMYMFSTSDGKAYIQCNTNSGVKTVTGIGGKTMNNFKNGFILMADRCSCGGSTGDITNILTMLNMVKNDTWDYSDGYYQQYPPYYLKTTTTDGIDIWEL